MLKPVDPTIAGMGPGQEPSIGGLVHQLVEDGKAYARAEFTLVKITGTTKAKAIALPVGLIAASILFVQAALTVLAVGIALGLARLIGPVLGGFIAFLVFAAIAGAMVWFGMRRLRSGS